MSMRTLFAARAPRARVAPPPRRLRLEQLDDRALPSGYFQTNLASDIPGEAQFHDADLVDAWGISIGNPTGTIWVSGRATDVSTVYTGDVNGNQFVVSPLVVDIPGDRPTGQVFNGSNTDFIVTAPATPRPIADPVGDFLPTYEGPHDPALDVVAHEVRIVGDRLEFFGRMAGPIGAATQPENGFYLFGVDRGLGTARFLAGTPLIGPNVKWDLVVRVNRDGTGHINHPLTGLRTPLDPADIRITGNELTASVPLSLLTPAPGELRPPEQWTYNLWPRIGEVRGQNQLVSDLAPDDGNSPVRPMVSGAARFIFASETGHITAWNANVGAPPPPPPSRNAFIKAPTPGAVHTALAIHTNATTGSFLYAADFVGGKIDVFDKAFKPTTLSGSFVDPDVPAGYEPFNIWNLGGKLYVAYARQENGDALPDGGHGYISVFDTSGHLLSHLVDDSHLKEPWGMAIAPANFGDYSGALLVANTANGKIDAYDPVSGAFLGRLANPSGEAIHIKGLWALHFGNGTTSGDSNALYFTAARNHEHGLFGSLRVAPTVGVGERGVGGLSEGPAAESLLSALPVDEAGSKSEAGTEVDGSVVDGVAVPDIGPAPGVPPISGDPVDSAKVGEGLPAIDGLSAEGLGLEEDPLKLGCGLSWKFVDERAGARRAAG